MIGMCSTDWALIIKIKKISKADSKEDDWLDFVDGFGENTAKLEPR